MKRIAPFSIVAGVFVIGIFLLRIRPWDAVTKPAILLCMAGLLLSYSTAVWNAWRIGGRSTAYLAELPLIIAFLLQISTHDSVLFSVIILLAACHSLVPGIYLIVNDWSIRKRLPSDWGEDPILPPLRKWCFVFHLGCVALFFLSLAAVLIVARHIPYLEFGPLLFVLPVLLFMVVCFIYHYAMSRQIRSAQKRIVALLPEDTDSFLNQIERFRPIYFSESQNDAAHMSLCAVYASKHQEDRALAEAEQVNGEILRGKMRARWLQILMELRFFTGDVQGAAVILRDNRAFLTRYRIEQEMAQAFALGDLIEAALNGDSARALQIFEAIRTTIQGPFDEREFAQIEHFLRMQGIPAE